MLESPLPQWVKDQLPEMIAAYLKLLPLLKDHCESMAAAGQRNQGGEIWDGIATIDGYRLDAKYAAGQAAKLLLLMRERLTPAEWEVSPYAEMPRNPVNMADWAWSNPWKHLRLRLTPAAMDEAPLAWRDFYLLYPEKERKALVYTLGCGMSLQQTADKMSVSVRRVRNLLDQARSRGSSARDDRAGIAGSETWSARIGGRE